MNGQPICNDDSPRSAESQNWSAPGFGAQSRYLPKFGGRAQPLRYSSVGETISYRYSGNYFSKLLKGPRYDNG